MKNYCVRGCKDVFDKIEDGKIWSHIAIVDNSEAEFWRVCEMKKGVTENWVADFRDFNDAEMFALEKEKEEKR